MRRVLSYPTIAVAAALVAVIAAAVIFADSGREATCELPAESARQLRLDAPGDQAHLDEDIQQILRTATAFRERVTRQKLQSSSRDAVANHASRPARAFEYCKRILADEVARRHQIDRAVVKTRVETIAAAPVSAGRE